jgi:hypothetical protein
MSSNPKVAQALLTLRRAVRRLQPQAPGEPASGTLTDVDAEDDRSVSAVIDFTLNPSHYVERGAADSAFDETQRRGMVGFKAEYLARESAAAALPIGTPFLLVFDRDHEMWSWTYAPDGMDADAAPRGTSVFAATT